MIINEVDYMSDLPLRDIHLPDSISWWPLSFGWWILLGLVAIAFLIIYCIQRQYFKATLRKETLNELSRIEKTFLETENALFCISELSVLLRRAALSKNLPAGVIGLSWLKLLDEPLEKPEFSEGIGRLLMNAPYQRHVDKDSAKNLIELCRRWAEVL